MNRESFDLFKEVAVPYFSGASKILEIGPIWGQFSLRELVKEKNPRLEYFYSDIKESNDSKYIQTDGNKIDIEDSTFDVVFSANVFEHLRRPWEYIFELKRICKGGGYIICESPVNWVYHPSPVDCWRIMPDGYVELYKYADIKVVEATMIKTGDHSSIIIGRK